MSIDEIVEAWRVNNCVNLELLELCVDEQFELKPGKGKTIRSNFVHLVSTRRMWVEEKMRKEAALIPKLDWKTASRDEVRDGLSISSELMEDLLRKREERTKPDRWTTSLFFAYCIAHEAHHRSQVELALRVNQCEPEDMLLYELWNWPKKARNL